MATAALVAPIPKYAIGDTVYVAIVERSVERLPCPDCFGSGKWSVASPAGGEYTTDCPRCKQTYSLNRNLPSLAVERWVGVAAARPITGIEINAATDTWRSAVEYRSVIGQGSYYTMKEADVFASADEAQVVADQQAAEKNVAVEQSPEVLSKRHFASLTLDEGRWDEFKNGIWNTQYHAGCLLEKVRECLIGEDGDEDRTDAEALEALRDAARWDFKYHVENLPLLPLVTAALSSSDATVKGAADALPEPMKKLLGGTFIDHRSE